jgi:hypothetical protein
MAYSAPVAQEAGEKKNVKLKDTFFETQPVETLKIKKK